MSTNTSFISLAPLGLRQATSYLILSNVPNTLDRTFWLDRTISSSYLILILFYYFFISYTFPYFFPASNPDSYGLFMIESTYRC